MILAARPLNSLDVLLQVVGHDCYREYRMLVPDGLAAAGWIPSSSCSVTDLAGVCQVPDAARRGLVCGAGREEWWHAGWRRRGVCVPIAR
jgi:hypothetical protein